MGDWFQTLVATNLGPCNVQALASAVRASLLSRGIISPERRKNVLGGDGIGHPPGSAWTYAVTHPDDLLPSLVNNGVSIKVGRIVAVEPSGDQRIKCPKCSGIRDADEDFLSAISAWYEGNDDATKACGQCGATEVLRNWRGEPPFAIGSLAITFWNWPQLSPAFIASFGPLVPCELVLVSGKL